MTLWAFLGLESATIPAEEVKDPERTLPRATMFGTLATTGMYVLATVAIMGVIPAARLAKSNAPFADAAQSIFGSSMLGVSPGKIVAAVARRLRAQPLDVPTALARHDAEDRSR